LNWQDDYKKRVASFPAAVRDAHARSSKHRAEVQGSARCGCFHCCATFAPIEIAEWVDEDQSGLGQTALCPKCGIDSVLGDRSGFPVSSDFLASMKAHWFSD